MIFLGWACWTFLTISGLVLPTSAQVAGGVIDSTDNGQITVALDAVLAQGGFFDFYRIAIGFANEGGSFVLQHPRWYNHRGGTNHALPPEVSPSQTGLGLFRRNTISLSGTEGVVAFEITGTPLCLAIMWNLPSIGYNTMNVKIYPNSVVVGEDLYHQMVDVAGQWGTGMWGTRSEFGINVRGSITTGFAAKLIAYIDTSGYNLGAGPSYNAWCKSSLFSKECIRECSPIGTCETGKSCSDDRDCVGSLLTCSKACE